MAVNVIKRTWLQDRMVRPETLNGMAFQAEAGAHRFEITGYDSNGNVMAFSGTVTAIFLRPDNTDVSLTGVISNGVAQVTLSQECYQVPGRFGLAIFVNSGNTKTVVYKCIGPVGMTSSGVEASSVVQSVSTLIDRIEAAVNSIPQDYSALSKSVSATCPEMRDGSTGNPWNTDSITTKYVIKIDKSCDELILEYIGSTQAQYYVFGYSVFNGVADGTESYAARTSAASFLDYPEKYVQTEPYVIIPVSQLGDYTHIAIVLWAKSDETTFIPLRIATEQNNLRVTFRHASYMGHEEINNRSVKVGVQNASKMASPLKLVHFSDLHRDVNALNRIRASAKYVCPNADNIICTGDMVANTYAEITSWWIPEIMTCIGNHDTASYDGTYDWTALTMAQRDEMYISPFKSYWGIVHTAGTSYYYKDYTAAHIRLIVMDAMLYSGTPGAEATAQTQWLANLLASAITDSLHVIIAIHAPHGGSVPVACSFTKLGQETMPVNMDCNTPDVVINTVATAIGNGLHFIGYICGHTHQDAVWDCTGDRSQLMYTVTCAAVDQTAQWANSDQYRSEELDAFNVLTIDTASTTIKILRGGGANTDVALRPRVSMVINYSTGKIITDTYASGTQDAVVYGDAQDLTDAQKAQARANIGAGSAADVSENTADITANANEITSLKSAFNGNIALTGAEIGYYSKRFSVVANSAHSAANDQIICAMKQGESYYVAIDTDNTEDAISCQLQRIVEGSSTHLAGVTTNVGYENAPSFTLSTSVELIGIYIPAQNHDVTYTVNIMRSDGYQRRIGQNELKNSLLNQSIKETNDGKADFSLYTDFVRGNLSQGNISLRTNKNRVSGLSIMKFDSDLTVNIASGFRFAYNTFINGVYQSDSGWKTGTHTIPANTEFKCMISRATEDASENADIALFVGQVTFITAFGSELNTLNTLTPISYNLQERAEHIDGIVSLDKDNFELGNITINSNGWTYSNSAWRVRTKESYDLELEVGDIIRIKDPTKAALYIGFKTSATTYGATGEWVSEMTCNYGGQHAFVIKAIPEAGQTDISYLLGLLEIVKYNNSQQNIKNLASHNPAIASANHRGMNRNAPENTLPAFQQSKRYGFDYVETDIAWTSDGVPVLLHDSTINRTARNADGTAISGEISIANITYEQALTYDFGIWKAAKWAGTKIPTFEQLLTLCKKQGIKVLAEIKSFGYTDERLAALVDMVRSCGSEDLVCWISFENTILATIKNLDAKATLGYLSATVTSQTISNAQELKTDANKVILMSESRSTETIALCKAASIPLWTYTINNADTMRSLPLYLCGVTSDLYPVNVVWSESAED